MRLLIALFIFINIHAMAQETIPPNLPYRSIPTAAKDYGAGNLIVRMIEGAGYRYHWATEDLTASDLDYQPSPEGKSVRATLAHIYDLTAIVRNTSVHAVSTRPTPDTPTDWLSLRLRTLQNLEYAAEHFKHKTPEELASLEVIFERGGSSLHFPFGI